MKTTIKTFGIIAVMTIIAFSMATCASVSIVSVDWDSLKGPEKTRQYLGVSSQEVTVFANYKDESRKEVTFLSASHDKDKTGVQTVTVTVMGQGSGTFETEVMEMTDLRIERPPSKTTYKVGDKADLAGIKVMGSWSDLPDAEIPTYQVTVSSFDSSSAGNKLVTVNFKGKTATFPVTVTASGAPAAAAAATPAPAAPAASQPTQPAQQQPSTQQTYRIGDTGPGGGIVFYDKGSYSDGWRYLEVAPVNQSTSVRWSPYDADIPGATGRGIGTGRANTAAIIQARPSDTASENAAKSAASYKGGGKTDWFLPSIDELAEMYKARAHLNTGYANFWSSTQDAPAIVLTFDFNAGRSLGYGKTVYSFYVRAIRAF